MKYRVLVRQEITYMVDVETDGGDPEILSIALAQFTDDGDGTESDCSDPWVVSYTPLPE